MFFQWSGCCWAVSCDITRSLYCGHWQPSIGAAVSIFDNHAICDAFWRVRHVGVGPHPRVLIKRSAPQYMRVDKLSWSGFTRTDNRFTTSVLTRAGCCRNRLIQRPYQREARQLDSEHQSCTQSTSFESTWITWLTSRELIYLPSHRSIWGWFSFSKGGICQFPGGYRNFSNLS